MPSDENDSGQKSEKPTSRRLSEARKDGQVVKSSELSQVFGMTAAFLGLIHISPFIWRDLKLVFIGGLSGGDLHGELTTSVMKLKFFQLLITLLPEILLLVLLAAVVGAGSMALQTKFLWSNKLLKPKFKHLNPLTGIKRLFGPSNAFNVLKSIAKLAIIGPIAYFAFVELFPQFLGLMDVPLLDLMQFTGFAMSLIYWRIISLMLILAILDYAWQWWTTTKTLKMTKVEVKEEKKSIEGDEATRMRIRQMALQRVRDRMFQEIPTADVVVTNPTHFAVALKYTISPGMAPMVVAKGRGYVAERIKKMAHEHGIPVLERKELARALFRSVEVGQEIPYELFAAVAEILAYVYKLKGKTESFMEKRQAQTGQQ